MKKLSHVLFGLGCLSLIGGCFSSAYSLYLKSPNSKILTITGVEPPATNNYYLNSVSVSNKLTDNGDGTWESGQITASYGATYQIVDEDGNNVGSSYTTTTEGTYKFTYTQSSSSTAVDVLEKTVYFNFLPMANGGTSGRVWNQFYCYAYYHGATDSTSMTWPGQVMTSVNSNGLYKLTIDGSYNTVVFNNGGTDENGHMIKTADLSYDISKPQFGCTSKTDLTTYVASAAPSINTSSSFDYFLHTSHNSWVERSRAYGFEKTEDSSQYLLRCYLEHDSQFGIKDNGSGWWGASNMGTALGSDFYLNGGNICVRTSNWYNIYFKPGEHKIYISVG